MVAELSGYRFSVNLGWIVIKVGMVFQLTYHLNVVGVYNTINFTREGVMESVKYLMIICKSLGTLNYLPDDDFPEGKNSHKGILNSTGKTRKIAVLFEILRFFPGGF